MALQVFNLGRNPDGTTHDHFVQDAESHAAGYEVVITGPIAGTVTLDDGTVYDVSSNVIEVGPGHAAEVMHRIAMRYLREGHPKHLPTDLDPDPEPFRYVPPAEFAHELTADEKALCKPVIDQHAKLLKSIAKSGS